MSIYQKLQPFYPKKAFKKFTRNELDRGRLPSWLDNSLYSEALDNGFRSLHSNEKCKQLSLDSRDSDCLHNISSNIVLTVPFFKDRLLMPLVCSLKRTNLFLERLSIMEQTLMVIVAN